MGLSHLVVETLALALVLSLPTLLVSLTVGFLVSMFQALTQIQDQTLSFVPKLLLVSLTLALTGTWMTMQLMRFTTALWQQI